MVFLLFRNVLYNISQLGMAIGKGSEAFLPLEAVICESSFFNEGV